MSCPTSSSRESHPRAAAEPVGHVGGPAVLRLPERAGDAPACGGRERVLRGAGNARVPSLRTCDLTAGEFTQEDEDIVVMFASQAALVIANARRYREEQRARMDMETLVNTSPVAVLVFDAGTVDLGGLGYSYNVGLDSPALPHLLPQLCRESQRLFCITLLSHSAISRRAIVLIQSWVTSASEPLFLPIGTKPAAGPVKV